MNGDGFCGCGCGKRPNLAQRTDHKQGHVKGLPHRYIAGHQKRKPDMQRYVSRGIGRGAVKPEHVLVVERVLGKPLPVGAIVHHVDEVKSNNVPSNLVACQDRAYHNLLHRRMRALAACGHADWRACRFCKVHDDSPHLTVLPGRRQPQIYHRACKAADQRRRRQAA